MKGNPSTVQSCACRQWAGRQTDRQRHIHTHTHRALIKITDVKALLMKANPLPLSCHSSVHLSLHLSHFPTHPSPQGHFWLVWQLTLRRSTWYTLPPSFPLTHTKPFLCWRAAQTGNVSPDSYWSVRSCFDSNELCVEQIKISSPQTTSSVPLSSVIYYYLRGML